MNECVSKADVIELRGFDGPGKSKEPQRGGGEPNPGKMLHLGNLLPGLGGEGGGTKDPGLPSGGISVEDLEREQRETNKQENGNRSQGKHQEQINNNNNDQQKQGEGFNYDQIIEGINLNSLLGSQAQEVQQVAAPAPPQGSRFSQFFARPGGGGQGGGLQELEDSRRGSLHEELGTSILKEITGEGGGPSIRIPSPNQEERWASVPNLALNPPVAPDRVVQVLRPNLARSSNPDHDELPPGHDQQGRLS